MSPPPSRRRLLPLHVPIAPSDDFNRPTRSVLPAPPTLGGTVAATLPRSGIKPGPASRRSGDVPTAMPSPLHLSPRSRAPPSRHPSRRPPSLMATCHCSKSSAKVPRMAISSAPSRVRGGRWLTRVSRAPRTAWFVFLPRTSAASQTDKSFSTLAPVNVEDIRLARPPRRPHRLDR